MRSDPGQLQVLLFVAHQGLASAVGKLMTSQAMVVTTARTEAELEEAASSQQFHVGVTITNRIQGFLQATSLPVVNVEAFVFAHDGDAHGNKPSRQLDKAAFLQRVLDVADSYGRFARRA
jgi:hypothetical protein